MEVVNGRVNPRLDERRHAEARLFVWDGGIFCMSPFCVYSPHPRLDVPEGRVTLTRLANGDMDRIVMVMYVLLYLRLAFWRSGWLAGLPSPSSAGNLDVAVALGLYGCVT
jgi:hypothetical protein